MNQHSANGERPQAIKLGHIMGSLILSLDLGHQALKRINHRD
jgi:hypothetical protein